MFVSLMTKERPEGTYRKDHSKTYFRKTHAKHDINKVLNADSNDVAGRALTVDCQSLSIAQSQSLSVAHCRLSLTARNSLIACISSLIACASSATAHTSSLIAQISKQTACVSTLLLPHSVLCSPHQESKHGEQAL